MTMVEPKRRVRLSRVMLAMVWFGVALGIASLAFRQSDNPAHIGWRIVFCFANPWMGALLGGGVGTLLNRLPEGLVAGLLCGTLAAAILIMLAYGLAG